MVAIRGIPDMYLSAACIVFSFLMFYAAGTAFARSTFYGVLFLGIAFIIFIAGIFFGRRVRSTE